MPANTPAAPLYLLPDGLTGPVSRLRAVTFAVLSGGCVLAAFPPVGWWWLAPVGVGLLTLGLLGYGWRWAAILGAIHGLVFFVPLLHWTGLYVGWWPWIALAGFEACYLAALGAATAAMRHLVARASWTPWLLPPLVAVLWVGQETLRSSIPWGGFPWGRLAFSQAEGPLLWWAAIGGAPAVTFAVALCGGCIALAVRYGLRGRSFGHRAGATAFIVVMVASVLGVGLAAAATRPGYPTSDSAERLRVAVVQGNVPRAGLDFNAQRQAVLNNHAEQTHQLAARVTRGEVGRPDVVIWPENSSDIDPYRDPGAAAVIDAAARAIGVPLLIGAVLDGPGEKVRNAGIVWHPATGPGETYIKRHPVPFAEYVPHRKFFRSITEKVDLVRSDFEAGDRPGVLQLGPVRVGDVICFEVAYDDLSADVVTGGGQLFVVQTNNATFGRTAQSKQQLAMVRLRAVEHGRVAVMASTTGISAIVSPRGTVLESTELFTSDVLLREVQLATSRTLATTAGAWPGWIMSLLAGLAVAVAFVSSRTSSRTTGRSPQRLGRTLRASGGDAMALAGSTTVATSQPAAGSNSVRGQARVLVVIPTFNEAGNIAQITSRLRVAAPEAAVLITDDNSPDGTGDIADRLARGDDSVHVLHREGKQGLGAAYVAGFEWARAHHYDVIVEMDADGSHAPEQLPRLPDALQDADLVIGSRWVPGGEVRNWPRRRELLSRLGNRYTRFALGVPVRDATGGFRAYRREVLDTIDWDDIASQGYCFQVDLTWRTFQAGFRIAEVPITFSERERGASKMSTRIVAEALWLVMVWGVRARFRRVRATSARILRRG